jgi:hypothetical protein
VADAAFCKSRVFWIERRCANKRRFYHPARNNVLRGEPIRPWQARRQYMLQRREHCFRVRVLPPVCPEITG